MTNPTTDIDRGVLQTADARHTVGGKIWSSASHKRKVQAKHLAKERNWYINRYIDNQLLMSYPPTIIDASGERAKLMKGKL